MWDETLNAVFAQSYHRNSTVLVLGVLDVFGCLAFDVDFLAAFLTFFSLFFGIMPLLIGCGFCNTNIIQILSTY